MQTPCQIGSLESACPAPRLSAERKFISAEARAGIAVALLDQLLMPDGEFPENTINSIYYETRNFDAYSEKANGDLLKHKVRLRWYGSAKTDSGSACAPAFLEQS